VASEHQIFALIEALERKIELLKTDYDAALQQIKQLKDEKVALEKHNQNLEKYNQAQEATIKRLQKKQPLSEKNASKSKDFGKLVKDNLSGTDTNAELKRQLDEYIRELERCIAHMSSLS
jgi:DNA repair exonuclease SbcCD ATPase subunit